MVGRMGFPGKDGQDGQDGDRGDTGEEGRRPIYTCPLVPPELAASVMEEGGDDSEFLKLALIDISL